MNARLFGGQEGRAHPGTGRTQHHGRRYAASVDNSAGPEYRHVHCIHDLGDQRHGSHGRIVATGIVALGHDHVHATLGDALGMKNFAHHRDDKSPIGVKPIHPGAGIPEPRCVDGYSLLDDDLHLGLKELLGEDHRTVFTGRQGSQFPAAHSGQALSCNELGGKFLIGGEVGHSPRRFHHVLAPHRGGQKRIHAKGTVGQASSLLYHFAQRFRAHRRRPEHAKPARV